VALRPAELVRLERDHGSLEAAAEALPQHRAELERAAANARLIAANVAAAVPRLELGARPPIVRRPLGPELAAELAAAELQPAQQVIEAALVNVGLGRQKGEPGAREKDFSGEQVEDVVRMWALRETHVPPTSQNAIHERTGLSRAAVKRIVRLVEAGALEWDEKRGPGLLGINGRFRATPATISLRTLEKAHGLKPLA
jgi:hypothetical protein